MELGLGKPIPYRVLCGVNKSEMGKTREALIRQDLDFIQSEIAEIRSMLWMKGKGFSFGARGPALALVAK